MKKIISVFTAIAIIACVLTSCNLFSKSNYVKGTFDKDGFKSEFLNLQFEAPDGYKMSSQSELDDYIKASAEQADVNIDYAKSSIVYEMGCAGEDDIPVVYVVCERATNSMKLEKYIDNFITGFKSTADSSYDKYDISEAKSKKFADETWQLVSIEGEIQGVELKQDVYFKKVADRMVTVQFTYTDDYPIKDLLKGFSTIK